MAKKRDNTGKETFKEPIKMGTEKADAAAAKLLGTGDAAKTTAGKSRSAGAGGTGGGGGNSAQVLGGCAELEIIVSDLSTGLVYPVEGEIVRLDIPEGGIVKLEAKPKFTGTSISRYKLKWRQSGGGFFEEGGGLNPTAGNKSVVNFRALDVINRQTSVILDADKGNSGVFVEACRRTLILPESARADIGDVQQEISNLNETFKDSSNRSGTIPVSLQKTIIPRPFDAGFWQAIRSSTRAIGFGNYLRFMDLVLCGIEPEDMTAADYIDNRIDNRRYRNLLKFRALPFNDTDAYRLLKVATEAFLLINGGVKLETYEFDQNDVDDLDARLGGTTTLDDLNRDWNKYLNSVPSSANPIIPYLALINQKFGTETLRSQVFLKQPTLDDNFRGNKIDCLDSVRNKLIQPFLVELIWSYWHEEGMLVQSMNAISRRFQNVSTPNGIRDPLANLEIDPLRGLNNLLWGYVQDEQHRLGLVRRVYEYKHQYGIGLQGKAVPKLYPADNRSKFIEAFHHLLHLASVFYKQDDDTTVNSDGFPLLNALREVHLILSHGSHNQFGDLPSTARQEMLIQQWLLARPEFREFLPTRNMVAYPEPWMDRVDAIKSLQGWTDISIDHFNRLAVFGEQILLSIRFGAWSHIDQSAPAAASWARYWRAEIQGYIHDYRAVTGVDLTSSTKIDSVPPSVHLFNRYMAQARR